MSNRYDEVIKGKGISTQLLKLVNVEKRILKWAKTLEVYEALKIKELVETNLRGRTLFPILQARKAKFNPLERNADVEEKALKRLDEIMQDYISIILKYVHEVDCSGNPLGNPSDEDEPMQLSDDCEKIVEQVQPDPIIEEEVLESLVLESEASLEKEAEASHPIKARSEGKPSKDGTSDQIHKVCEYILGDKEERKSKSDLEKDEPEQSLHINTHFSHIRTAPADSQEMSSNEGTSTGGAKLMKSMTAMMGTLQKIVVEMQSNMVKIMKTQKSNKKEFASLLKTHNEMELAMKRNTYEINILNKTYTKFEKNFFKWQTDLLDCERENSIELHQEVMDRMSLIQIQMVELQGHMSRADVERLEQDDSFARQIQVVEDAEAAANKEKNIISHNNDNVKKGEVSSRGGSSSRGGGGVSTGTRSKRKQTGDGSCRPTKRGGGRSGDHGGGSGLGGRSLPPL
ncbi:keratin, type I cytoskeletal 9-like [Impatiens glandulifera]|uniref:keratin, type I cytoskeletal 9-like n=1 Tax=Impatiens glandulifera TaxID=253017 RepID=UPI001FB0DBF5|nr:keratin, type I cytoskeletal 9-like [Impatiens glandulifera]